jgi:hypothetical protein
MYFDKTTLFLQFEESFDLVSFLLLSAGSWIHAETTQGGIAIDIWIPKSSDFLNLRISKNNLQTLNIIDNISNKYLFDHFSFKLINEFFVISLLQSLIQPSIYSQNSYLECIFLP